MLIARAERWQLGQVSEEGVGGAEVEEALGGGRHLQTQLLGARESKRWAPPKGQPRGGWGRRLVLFHLI